MSHSGTTFYFYLNIKNLFFQKNNSYKLFIFRHPAFLWIIQALCDLLTLALRRGKLRCREGKLHFTAKI